jgi:HEAT repeat protein
MLNLFIGFILLVVGVFYFVMKKAPVAEPPPPPAVVQAPATPPPPPVEPPIQQRLNAQTIATVRSMLIDTNPSVRKAAIDLLYTFNDPQVYVEMNKLLHQEQDPDVLKAALDMLAKKKDKAGEPLIVSALKHAMPEVRLQAVNDLIPFTDEETIPPLTALMKDNDETVRLNALQAVQKIQKDIEERRRKEEEERRRREAEEAARRAAAQQNR